MRCSALLLVMVLLVAGCSGEVVVSREAPSPALASVSDERTTTPTRLVEPGWATIALRHDGRARPARVFLPTAVTSKAAVPLVVALHGGLGSGEQLAATTRFEAVAEREGFIVAFPDGVDRTWNGGRCCNPAAAKRIDDVGYLAVLIEESAKRFPVDRGRVYMTGHSNGAIMAFRFACERPVLVVAIVPVAGSLEVPCPASGPSVALLSIHGDADRNHPLDGGRGERSIAGVDFTSQAASMAAWNKAFECAGPATTTSADGLTKTTWPGCRGGVAAGLTVIAGADHPWPGAQERRASALQGVPTQLMDATEAAWAFFKQHSRR